MATCLPQYEATKIITKTKWMLPWEVSPILETLSADKWEIHRPEKKGCRANSKQEP